MAHLDTPIPLDFQPQDGCVVSELPELIDYRKSSRSQPKRSTSLISFDMTVPCTTSSEHAGVSSCGSKLLRYTTPPSPPPTDPCLQATIPLPYLSLRSSNLSGSFPSSCEEFSARSLVKGFPASLMPPTPPLSNPTMPSSLPAIENENSFLCYDGVASGFYHSNPSIIGTSPLTPNSLSTSYSSLSPESPRSPLESNYPDSIHLMSLPCALLYGNCTEYSATPFMNVFHSDSGDLHDRNESKDFIGFPGKLPLLSPLNLDQKEDDCPSLFAPICFCEDAHNADGGLLEGDSVVDDACLLLPLPLPLYQEASIEENAQCNIPQHLPIDPMAQNPMQKLHLQSLELYQYPVHPYDDGISRFTCTSSPSLSRRISLPDLDDGDFDDVLRSIISTPSSPSLRFSRMLPEDEDNQSQWQHEQSQSRTTSQLQAQNTDAPSPPNPSLLALPGAEIDDDLIPLCPSSRPPSDVATLFTLPSLCPERLLFDGDEFAHQLRQPGQRSPSPEPCGALETSVVTDAFPRDEELKKVCDLLKRTRDAERAAMQLESIVEREEKTSDVNALRLGSPDIADDGSRLAVGGHGRLLMARRNTRKKQKMCRELATLLRLKLAEKGFRFSKDASGAISIAFAEDNTGLEEDKSPSDPRGRAPLKKRINSPHQLLVKMFLDRHETGFSDSSRRCIFSDPSFPTTGTRRSLPSSPLGKSCFTSTDGGKRQFGVSTEEHARM